MDPDQVRVDALLRQQLALVRNVVAARGNIGMMRPITVH
jgi:hypothetical protein